ncbi:hypothetical protein KKH16_03155 [Patescibacteria group bacterium]|nr:hypothetical protein [Patescibacteria group bacterium]
MEKLDQALNNGREFASWKISEYQKHNRGKKWYIMASIISLSFIIYSFFTSNFLFAVIIIIVTLVIVINDGQNPNKLIFSLTDEGIAVGKSFYDYDEIKHFAIIYKPKQEIKNIYFEFKNVVKTRLSIPLENMNPLLIRENLLKYLPEDLERTDQPLSEALTKLFKL